MGSHTLTKTLAQRTGAAEYTNSISAEQTDKTPITSVLDMTQNNLTVRLQ